MTSSRSTTIQTAVLVLSGAAVAAATLWGSRLPDRITVSLQVRRRTDAPLLRTTGREILGADEALRRWAPRTP